MLLNVSHSITINIILKITLLHGLSDVLQKSAVMKHLGQLQRGPEKTIQALTDV